PNLPAVRELVRRARRVHWLNPEPRTLWGTGDSAAPEYASLVEMHECRSVRRLRDLVGRRVPVWPAAPGAGAAGRTGRVPGRYGGPVTPAGRSARTVLRGPGAQAVLRAVNSRYSQSSTVPSPSPPRSCRRPRAGRARSRAAVRSGPPARDV